MRRTTRKSNWPTILAGAAALKAVPKRPLMGVAAAAVGGYMLYRWLR